MSLWSNAGATQRCHASHAGGRTQTNEAGVIKHRRRAGGFNQSPAAELVSQTRTERSEERHRSSVGERREDNVQVTDLLNVDAGWLC